MQAQPKTVSEMLHTEDQYIIPLFQRLYSWEKTRRKWLHMDIWALLENGADPSSKIAHDAAFCPFWYPANYLLDAEPNTKISI